MNEKHQQYFNLRNDKNLIEKRMPTESDLQMFEEVKKAKRKHLKKSCIVMTFILLFIIMARFRFKKYIWYTISFIVWTT